MDPFGPIGGSGKTFAGDPGSIVEVEPQATYTVRVNLPQTVPVRIGPVVVQALLPFGTVSEATDSSQSAEVTFTASVREQVDRIVAAIVAAIAAVVGLLGGSVAVEFIRQGGPAEAAKTVRKVFDVVNQTIETVESTGGALPWLLIGAFALGGVVLLSRR